MKEEVKIPVWFASILVTLALGGVVTLQAYTLQEISALKANVAGLTARLDTLTGNTEHVAKK